MTAQTMSENEVAFVDIIQTAADVHKASERNPKLLGLPVSIQVVLGGAKLSFAELISLGEHAIIKLDAAIDDPVDLVIADRVFARAALIEDPAGASGLAVKIIEVIDDVA